MIVLFKNTIKLVSLFLLLLLSFIYTDKVFNEARSNDPLMKEVISYKRVHDVKPVEPKIKDDEMILGMSGLIINEEKSYLSEFYQRKAQTGKTDTQAAIQPETEQEAVKKDAPEHIAPPEETVKLTAEENRDLPEVKILGEAFKTYIIAQVGDRLVIVDKHAAHERIIFNKLKQSEMSSQYLFTPVTVTLNKTEYSALLENIELLSKAGYAVEDFGIGTVIVRECPCEISLSDIPSQITEIASYLVEKNADIETEKIDWIYHSAACRAAVKAGSSMHPYEQQKFVEMLLSDESVRYCPHGRPVLIEMTRNELEKQFGRIQ